MIHDRRESHLLLLLFIILNNIKCSIKPQECNKI